MPRKLSGLLLCLTFLVSALFAAGGLWGSPKNLQKTRVKPDPCAPKADPDYDKAVAEATTDKHFSTELVDHLPVSPCVPSPKDHLHHIVGAPGRLTYVADINAYMRTLADKSSRVKVFPIGKSEEGREMLLIAISDAENLAKLDRYREITARLADPRTLTSEEAKKIISEGKPMYWASGSIHSSETGAPEMLMELAYRLAVEESPFIQAIRRDAVILLTPVVEVDGRDRMVDVYKYRSAHRNEPQLPLVWWGHYVAHDNNRDGMQLALALSRNMMQAFFKFHPQVFHDLHESLPYLYISTGTGPYNAWLDPMVINEWQSMAYYEVEEMTKRGVIGVWTHNYYDGWAPNYMFYIANGHNSIGRFYETFGNGGADTRVRTLNASQTSREWYRPNPPLAKVNWSIRNNINMQQSALLLGMSNLAAHKAQFLENFWLKSKRSVEKASLEGPAAWVFPADDARPLEQARLLNLLQAQGVEVHRSTEATSVAEPKSSSPEPPADGPGASVRSAASPQAAAKVEAPPRTVTIPAQSYIVRMDQPYSRMADMMLDTQYYAARDPRSYDDTGWTVGALRNVRTLRILDHKILEASMAKVEGEVQVAGTFVGSGTIFLINHNTENPLATVRFAVPKAKILAAEFPFEAEGKKFAAGTFITEDEQVRSAALARGLVVVATARMPQVQTHPLATPRVALLFTWQSTQNDGWFRIAMDKLEIPYTYIADTVVREFKPGELRSKFDVVIIPPSYNNLAGAITGIVRRDGSSPMPWKNSVLTPNLVASGMPETDDIRGGLGLTGIAGLDEFVRQGGLLLAIQGSALVAAQAGMLELTTVSEPANIQAPGSVLLTNVADKQSPIAYGYGDRLYVYFHDGPVLRVGLGRAGGGEGGSAADASTPRSSGRGTANDPDVIQGRPYVEPERPVRRTPAEQEFYVPEEQRDLTLPNLPPPNMRPRVILRFAAERELLLSGMITGGNEIAERPALVDVPHGLGHVVLFAHNPMWRDETMGSFWLVFNAMLNFDHLDAGR
jgi:hypothetical protein